MNNKTNYRVLPENAKMKQPYFLNHTNKLKTLENV